MTLVGGTRLGPYEIVSALGAGGMGEVYRAKDTKLGRDVAIKILPSAFNVDRERLARFEREARVLASLNHPHIAHIYGLETAPSPFIVMEFVDGGTLADRLRRAAISVADSITIARQIVDALDAAHERGIIHRDLKPANIAFTAAGEVKILDFGLAKAGGSGEAGGVDSLTHSPTMMAPTVDGMLLGTAPYMSPEQARGKPVDKRADIWAFGCVWFEMLTGRRAFDGATAADVLASIIEREPKWETLPASTPPHVIRTLHRCLQKDQKTRVRDIGDVRADLESSSADAPLKLHRRVPIVSTAAALLVGAGISAAWLMRARTIDPPESTAQAVAVQLTDYGGHESSPAISPDGRSIVFVSDHGGTPDIWLRQVAGGEPVRLTSDTAVESDLAFGPDGENIYFTRVEGRDESIWRIGVLGGQPSKVIGPAHIPSIAPDGRHFAFFVRQHENVESLLVSALDGTEKRTLAENIPPFPPLRASWSPDGRQVSYVRAGLFAPQNLFVVDLGTGVERQVTHFTVPPSGVGKHAWLPDGRHVAVSYTRSTATQTLSALGVLDLRDGSITRVAGSINESLIAPGISADGKRVVASNARIVREVWRVPATSIDPDVNGHNAVRIMDATKDPLWTFVTRDGRQLLYNSPATGSRNLWLIPLVDGARARQLTTMPDDVIGHSSLSPDGTRVAFVSFARGTSDIWVQNVDGSDLRQLTDDPAADSWPVWSPAGDAIVFTSATGGRQEIHTLHLATHAVAKLADGFFRGDWVRKPSGDGSWIITYTGNGRIRLIDVERKAVLWERSLDRSDSTMPTFAADGRSFFVATQQDRDHDVIQVGETATGSLRVVARVPFHVTFRANRIDEGRAFLVNRQDSQSHLVLVDRFWTRSLR